MLRAADDDTDARREKGAGLLFYYLPAELGRMMASGEELCELGVVGREDCDPSRDGFVRFECLWRARFRLWFPDEERLVFDIVGAADGKQVIDPLVRITRGIKEMKTSRRRSTRGEQVVQISDSGFCEALESALGGIVAVEDAAAG